MTRPSDLPPEPEENAAEPTEEESLFPNFKAVDDYIHQLTGEWMDANAEMIQFSRKSIFVLDEFLERITDIVNSIKEAHIIGSMMTNSLTGDMIMNEFGVEPVEEEDE